MASETFVDRGADTPTGAVVVLLPADPESLAVAGGDPPEQLHMTICYLGDASVLDEEEKQAAIDAVNSVSPMGPAVDAAFAGVTEFADNDGDGQRAVALTYNSEEAHTIHELLEEMLGVENIYGGFIPHVTLGYNVTVDPAAYDGTTTTFDRLALWWAGETLVENTLGEVAVSDIVTDTPAPTGGGRRRRTRRRVRCGRGASHTDGRRTVGVRRDEGGFPCAACDDGRDLRVDRRFAGRRGR